MVRLAPIDGAGLSPKDLSEALLANVLAAPLAGAVVAQIVTGVPREIWSLVDRSAAERAAASAVHYEVTPRHQTSEQAVHAGAEPGSSIIGGLAEQLESIIAMRVGKDLSAEVRELATSLLGSALNQVAPSDQASDEVTVDCPGTPDATRADRGLLVDDGTEMEAFA
jgi:hypothetical protein